MGRIAIAALLAAFLLGCGAGPAVDERSAEARCAPCHLDDYETARPTHPGKKPTTCAVCHRQHAWHPVAIEHDGWPLDGAHRTTECFACHHDQPPVFEGTRRECIGCHAKAFAHENTVARWHARFAETCADCHQTSAWKPAKSEPGFDVRTVPPTPQVAPSKPRHVTPVPSPPRPRKPTEAPAPDPSPDPSPDPPVLEVPDVRTGATRHR